ncbi:DUF6457 domain-containing protein, partial [Streptomyces sp. NPDC059371]|uniref:DUF6457 domain-containing protein n=1 Tax=Streptomyces sp. NPDC059371 TaxID=3346812 RepID=UPI0036B7BEBE
SVRRHPLSDPRGGRPAPPPPAPRAPPRPAAPLTTFLVGYAAARAGGGPEAVAEASRKAAALALRWADEDAPEATPGAASPGPTTATTATESDAG